VIWVSESLSQKALDEFFKIIGEKACEKIQVVAIDQHDDYAKSVRKNCKNAKIVWDRFHLMQNFGEALNEVRKNLHNRLDSSESEMVRQSLGKRFFRCARTSKNIFYAATRYESSSKNTFNIWAVNFTSSRQLDFLPPDNAWWTKID
jgi:transposase